MNNKLDINRSGIYFHSKNEETISKGSINIIKLITYFVIIDILFLPYFPYIIMPFSLPLVVAVLFLNGKIQKDIYYQMIILIIIAVLISVFISIMLNLKSNFILDNFKRSLQFITSFIYFFYFRWVWDKYEFNLKKILLLFLAYQFILGILFFIDPLYIVLLKEKVYTAHSYAAENVAIFLRYSYLFVDPNTAAYFYLIVVFFIFGNMNLSYFENGFILVISIILLFAFQSNGALLSVLTCFFLYLFKNYKKILIRNVNIIFIIVLLIILSIALVKYIELPLWNDIVKIVERYIQRYDRIMYIPGNPRLRIYYRALTNFYPSIFGQGYTLLLEDSFFKPHSDHLRLIYSYGLVAYICVLIFFFKNILKSNFIFLVPAFYAFSINTLIDEQKLLVIFLIFLAITEKTKRDGSDLLT